MAIVFVTLVCAAVAMPFLAFAWAMQHRSCPHCGEAIEPDPNLVRMFTDHV